MADNEQWWTSIAVWLALNSVRPLCALLVHLICIVQDDLATQGNTERLLAAVKHCGVELVEIANTNRVELKVRVSFKPCTKLWYNNNCNLFAVGCDMAMDIYMYIPVYKHYNNCIVIKASLIGIPGL